MENEDYIREEENLSQLKRILNKDNNWWKISITKGK